MCEQLLIVEDNSADATLLMRMLELDGFKGQITWMRDGEQALDYLFQRGEHAQAVKPEAMILDLGLPRMNGSEVLVALRQEPRFFDLPVYVLSSSTLPNDIFQCHELGVKAFLTKPCDLREYQDMVKRLMHGFESPVSPV